LRVPGIPSAKVCDVFVFLIFGQIRKSNYAKVHKMSPLDNERFKSLLLAKQTEVSGSLCNRDEIVIEKASDDLDQVQLMGERELAIRNLDRDSRALRQIRPALSRIANGAVPDQKESCTSNPMQTPSAWSRSFVNRGPCNSPLWPTPPNQQRRFSMAALRGT